MYKLTYSHHSSSTYNSMLKKSTTYNSCDNDPLGLSDQICLILILSSITQIILFTFVCLFHQISFLTKKKAHIRTNSLV